MAPIPSVSSFAVPCITLLIPVLSMPTAAAQDASAANVAIFNDMPGQALDVSCRRAGEVHDFGERLIYGQSLAWGFEPNSWGGTRFTCTFRSNLRSLQFVVWQDDAPRGPVMLRPCTHCVWTVKEEGFFKSEVGQAMVFMHRWSS